MAKRRYQFKPNYLKKPKKKRSRFKLFFWSGLFFIFLAGALYLAIFSSVFKIREVLVEGTRQVNSEQIKMIASQNLQEKILGKIPRDSFFLAPEEKITQSILEKFAEIKKVVIERDLFAHSLVIKIEERESAAIWCQALPPELESELLSSTTSEAVIAEALLFVWPEVEKCFFVDDEGLAFKSAPIMSGGFLPIVYDETNQGLEIRGLAANSKILEFVLAAKKELALSDLNLTDFVIKSQSSGELKILVSEGWLIYLSLDFPATSQVLALKRVLEEEIKGKRTQLEYVDLRVQNRVYYKLKTS